MAAKKPIGYDKILLGVGSLVAVGLITMVALKAGSVSEAFEVESASPKGSPAIPGSGEVGEAIASIGQEHVWNQAKTAEGREVDLLTGIPWYLERDGRRTVDLLDEDEEDVHEGMKNIWFHRYGVPIITSDAPDRDFDNDGFTNREEYDGETDPSDPEDFPDLIDKLELAKLDPRTFLLTFSSEAAKTYQFRYEDIHNGRRRNFRTKEYIPAGDPERSFFFQEGPANLRFRLLKVEEKEVTNPRTGVSSQVKFATIEDLLPLKKGDLFELGKGRNNAQKRRDYLATLTLNAAGAQGLEFQVEERDRFALPYDPDADHKPYLFKKVLEDGKTAVIEYEKDGETQTKEITLP